jgi:hypothetical protein
MSNIPQPLSTISPDNKKILLNKELLVDIMFKNESPDNSALGYKGMIDIFIQKGLLNQTVQSSEFVFIGTWTNESDNEGNVINSLWKNSSNVEITEHIYSASGIPLPSDPNDPNDLKEWDWYVGVSAYSSYGSDQPEVTLKQLSIKVDESAGATIGEPLKIKTLPWFKYGEDALDNPTTDPPISGMMSESIITPQLIIVTKTNNKPESEVATGPNFPITYTINVDIAENQTLQSFDIVDHVSDYLLLYDPDTSNPSSMLGTVTDSSNNALITTTCVDSRKNLTIPGTNHGIDQQIIKWDFSTYDGDNYMGVGGNDITLTYRTYVPHKDINGVLILNKESDSEKNITETVTANYTYNSVPGLSTDTDTLTAKQLCIQKTVNTSSNPPIPLSGLNYSINIQVSDFFVLDNMKITDILTDGHHLTTDQQLFNNFVFTHNTQTYNLNQNDLTFTDDKMNILNSAINSQIKDRYTIQYNLNTLIKLINGSSDTRATGGLIKYDNMYADPYPSISDYNYDNQNNGGLEFNLSYEATIGQLYYARTLDINSLDNSVNKLDIGDKVNTTINIYADNLNWENSEETYYLNNESNSQVIQDNSSTNKKIGSVSVAKTIYSIIRDGVVINEQETIETLGLQSQDLVTYRVKIDISHQNFQSFNVDDYLPPPVTTSAHINLSFNTNAPDSILPVENEIKYGPDHTFYSLSNSHIFKNPDQVSKNTNSNMFRINYGNFQMPYYPDISNHDIGSKVIDILYTVKVSDEPTADKLKMTNQVYYIMTSTIGTVSEGEDYTSITVNQPTLYVKKAVVAFNQTSPDTSIDGPLPMTITYDDDGFIGTVDMTTPDIVTDVNDLNRGDLVKYCVTIKNTGSYDAYNVMIRDDQASNNAMIDINTIRVYDGTGNQMIVPSTNINDDSNSLSNFINDIGLDIGTIPDDSVRIITYVATILTTGSEINNSESVVNTILLSNYANKDKGMAFGTESDSAICNLRNISLIRKITYNSEDNTNISERENENVTIGEIVRIKSVITVPPGTIPDFLLQDEFDFKQNSSSNAGIEHLDTLISISGGTFTGNNGSTTSVLNNYTDLNQYRRYTFGTFTNNSTDDHIITLTHFVRVTDDTYNNVYIYGENNVSTKYKTNSYTKIYAYRDTNSLLNTSNNTRINIKEPGMTIRKSFHTTQSGFSKGDLVIYKLTVSSDDISGSIGAKNLVLTDTVPDNITVTKAYLEDLSESPFLTNTNNITYTFGDHGINETKIIYIEGILGDYHTGDFVTNTSQITYENLDSSIATTSFYLPPTDDVSAFDNLSLTKVNRTYNKTDSLTFTTYPTIEHLILNVTDSNDPTFNHPVISGKISGMIGDLMKTSVTVTVPKGTTYIKNIVLKIPSNLVNTMPSMDAVTMTYNYDMSQIVSTPETVVDTDTIQLPVNHLYTNPSVSDQTITFEYTQYIKNTSFNVAGKLINYDYNLLIENTDNMVNHTNYQTLGSVTGKKYYYVVEPMVTISQEINQIPLHVTDTFRIRVLLTVADDTYSTHSFNTLLNLIFDNTMIDEQSIINISIPSDWTYSSNIYTCNKVLDTNSVEEFIIEMKLKDGSDLLYGGTYNVTNQCKWFSQKDSSIPVTEDEKNKIRYYSDDTENYRKNNYYNQDILNICMEESLEKQRFGVCFEDALDFDYDYEDVVLNVIYKMYRNKRGIKRFIADIHIVSRGAAYDHTIGLSFNGLKTKPNGDMRNGSWSVYCINGDTGVITDNSSFILDYLDQTSQPNNLSILREDAIPVIISTTELLPADGAKPGYGFSANAANRTDLVNEWINTSTVRLMINFDSGDELVNNGKYFLPYIDIRGRSNNNNNKKYNDYEYRHTLGSVTDYSKRTFDYDGVSMSYNNFPKVLITTTDFPIVEDYGEISGYRGLKDAYSDFINYITNGEYPQVTNMVDMTDIRTRVVDANSESSWINNSAKVTEEHLMKRLTAEYDMVNIQNIKNKQKMNEYHNKNIFKLGNNVGCYGYLETLVPQGSVDLMLTVNGIDKNIPTYSSELSSGQFISDMVSTKNNEKSLYILESDHVTGLSSVIMSQNASQNDVSAMTDLRKIKTSLTGLIAIDNNCVIQCSDNTHNLINHNANNRKIYDACYFKDTTIITIGDDNDLIVTGSNTNLIDTGGIVNAMRIESSDVAIGILTAENKVYLIDDSNNQIEIFINKTIIDIDISNKNILGLSSDGEIYLYDIQSNVLNGVEPIDSFATNVRKMSCESDWVVVLKNNGFVEFIGTAGQAPNLSSVGSTYNKTYIDVMAHDNLVILKYI